MLKFATVLLIIGGLNWGLVGLFEFNLVAAIFGPGSILSRIIYTLVGLSAVYEVFAFRYIANRPLVGHRPGSDVDRIDRAA